MADDAGHRSDSDLGKGPSSLSREAVLRLLDASAEQGKRILFVDSAKQVARYQPKKPSKPIVKSILTEQTLKGHGKGRPGRRGGKDDSDRDTASSSDSVFRATLEQRTVELAARLERLSLLQRTFREMQVQRAIMGKGSKQVVGARKGGLSREEQRLNEEDLDELEMKQMGNRKKKLPEPEKGVRTGARVWKWKAERRR